MRWGLITGMYNVADLALEFCSYHFSLGVDRIIIADYGSRDGTLDRLASFVSDGRVEVVAVPTHHFSSYDPSNSLLKKLQEKQTCDWVSFLDPDEFQVGPADLKDYLAEQWSTGVQAVAIPRYNMTGIGSPPPGCHYLQHLTFRINTTHFRVSDPAARLSSPWIFSSLPPKVMVSAGARLNVITGDHGIVGKNVPFAAGEMQILHYPVRGYESFRQKVQDAEVYLSKNSEFDAGTAWHWRRWISLLREGRLEQEYELQFLNPKEIEPCISQGRVTPEPRLANWWEKQ